MQRANTLVEIPRVSVTIGVALTILAAAITVGYVFVSPEYKSAVVVFGTGIAASGAIASAIYMGRTLAIYIERDSHGPREIMFDYFKRWNDPQMFHTREVCRQVMNMQEKSENERKNELNNNNNLRVNIRSVLNFLEELALSVRLGRVDVDIAKRMFAGIVISVYHATEPWIRDQRNVRNRPQLWAELTWLYQEWSRG